MEFEGRKNLENILKEEILQSKLLQLFSKELEMFYEIEDPEFNKCDILFTSLVLPIYSKLDGIDNRYLYLFGKTQFDKLLLLSTIFMCKDKYYPCLIDSESFVLEEYEHYGKTKFEFHRILCDHCNMKLKNMCWVYDLETTGLIQSESFPKITEIFMKDSTTGMICFDDYVKIGNIEYDENFIEELTGITREKCNNLGTQYCDIITRLKYLISICDINTCLFIAHNGNNFDHRILFKDFNGGKIKTLDSMQFVPNFMEENPKSRKLSLLYEEIVGKKYNGKIHTSECDVDMVVRIMKKLKIDYKKLCFLK